MSKEENWDYIEDNIDPELEEYFETLPLAPKGKELIEILTKVANHDCAMIQWRDGAAESFSAALIVGVYNNLNDKNKADFETKHINELHYICDKLVEKGHIKPHFKTKGM